jgi:hypothetical protein
MLAYRFSFGLNSTTKGPNSFYDANGSSQLACYIGCHIRLCPAWHSCRNEAITFCNEDFARVIKLVMPRNEILSLIAVCDTQLMTEGFRNSQCYKSRFMTRNTIFSVNSRHIPCSEFINMHKSCCFR